MKWRLVGALLLAFWPLSQPALADVRQDGNLIQFSYSWGRVEQTFTDSIVTVTVTNNITNKIGGNGEVIDTYRISLGAEVIQKTEKHDAVSYSFTITGSQTLVLEGIDNGFWAGYYGPIMTVTSEPLAPAVEPVTESPSVSPTISPVLWDYETDENSDLYAEAPSGQVFSGVVARYVSKETACGIDVSEIVAAALVGTSSGTIPATNDLFGDPCPGEYKKLLVSVQYSSAIMIPPSESAQAEAQTQSSVSQESTQSPSPAPTPQEQPSPEPQPTPEPTYAPSPEPSLPQQTPTIEPSPEPTATVPSQSPTPKPILSPTAAPEIATQSPAPIVPPALPSTSPEAQPLPIISPTPVQSSEPPYEEPTVPATQAPEVSEETESETVSGTIETAFTETIGAAVQAVGELVEAFQSAGLDMTPEQREEAQDVVISTIIVSQVATTASAAAVSARKIK
jgi:hypothetical protein